MESTHFTNIKRKVWLRAVVVLFMLLGSVLLPAGLGGRQAPGAASALTSIASAADPDPDLCELLPSNSDFRVTSSSNPTQHCRSENLHENFHTKQIEITKYSNAAAAQARLKELYSQTTANNFGRWDPTTRWGDHGYGYEIIPINLNDPGGAFARGCYVVTGTAYRYPHTPDEVYGHLRQIDTMLSVAPCSLAAGIQEWRVKVDKSVNTELFGYRPPILRSKNGSVADLRDGMVLMEAESTIETNGFRVYLSWQEDRDRTWKVTLGPNTVAKIQGWAPPSEAPNRLIEVVRGLVGFFFPRGEAKMEGTFRASTHTVVLAIEGTEFILAHDDKTQTSTIQLKEGALSVTPTNNALPPVQLKAGTQIQVDAKSVSPVTPYVPLPGDPGTIFSETGKAVNGIFFDYWLTHGGLPQQGYPISNAFMEKSDLNGQTYAVQYFERAVFEHHPEYAPPNNILLSQLGTFQYKRKYPNGAPNQRSNTSAGSRLFTETGKRVGGKFLDYWNTHGGLAQQGLPLSEEFTEVSETDGKTYLVQYFERAVFEYHPEYAPPNDVLLSLLGNFFYKQRYTGGGGNPTPLPVATPTTVASAQCSGIPANQNMTVTPSNCAKAGTDFVFEAAGFNPGESVQAAVTAPDGRVYSASNPLIADQNGAIRAPNAVTLDTEPTSLPGLYTMVMEGVTSHKRATGYIRLLAP
jgi:hypothetical protein